MADSIEIITIIIAEKLVMNLSTVKIWVESNNYTLLQLNVMSKQIHYSEIDLPTLVDAIIYNKKYQISIY